METQSYNFRLTIFVRVTNRTQTINGKFKYSAECLLFLQLCLGSELFRR